MENIEDELLGFFDYLEKKKQTIVDELQPYYDKLNARLSAHMNTYGIANPKEKCLMNDLASVIDLERRLKETNSFDKLEEGLRKEVEAKGLDSKGLQNEIEIITEYELYKKDGPTNKKI